MIHLNLKRHKEALTLIVVFVIVLLASAVAVYFIAGRTNEPSTPRNVDQPSEVRPGPELRPNESPAAPAQRPDLGFFDELFSHQNGANVRGTWGEILAKLTLRLSLAALLGAALAFRPRRRILAIKRNPYVSQTQILLAVVASALMIIVGDNAARAFGIFAAVSLVRFRTNIRDPKEVTVLLISLAVGLATGVGRWDLALILALFSLILLWLLEYREPEQVFRSMELKITTRDVAATHETLREVFEKHQFDSELRALARESDSPGTIVYAVDISPTVSTDKLSEEILARAAGHVDGLEWEQKKSFSYLYQ
jgi:Domain of unknown function (DUF4956)